MTTSPSPAVDTALEILRSRSLATLVHEELQRRILAGAIRPGDKLNEPELAAALGVSRGPVREAFRALEEAGLVRTEKNRGVFVREVSLAEADEIYEVRAGLEECIGRLAAKRADAVGIAELRALLAQMREAARLADVDAYHPLNLRFHDRLAELSGNRTLVGTYRSLVRRLQLYRRETLAHGDDAFTASTGEHGAIVDALAARHAMRAGRLLREHVQASRRRLQSALERERDARLLTALEG
jgi:phosphonate utilization transcriptional regulator